jgi:hypothetical protein
MLCNILLSEQGLVPDVFVELLKFLEHFSKVLVVRLLSVLSGQQLERTSLLDLRQDILAST